MMKKLPVLLFIAFLLGNSSILRAQCYGTVKYDAFASTSSSTFSITTAHCNELIMISYDGWSGPGNGPVTVDGNPATHILTAFVYYYAVAETYAYIAPVAGVHNIVCTEPTFTSPYYLNAAAAFYATGTSNPLTIASLTNAQATVSCVGGGSVTANITTTIPNSMIYGNFDCNNGQGGPFVDSWTGATFLSQTHVGNGIDQSHAYEPCAVAGSYTVTANCSSSPSPCGGLALALVAIPPPLCAVGPGGLTAVATVTPPTCNQNNGNISIAVNGGSPPYTYTWTPPISTSSAVTGLSAGSYTCVVSDAACPQHDTTLVFNFPAHSLTFTATVTANEPCNGDCKGSVNTTEVGGTPPLVYTWFPSGGNGSSASGLCAGTYTVTLNDVNNCVGSAVVTITQPNPMASTATATTANCDMSNASATITVTGGTPAYTYLWTPAGGTTSHATGLSVGTYSVKVTDSRGCVYDTSITITQPPPIVVKFSADSLNGCAPRCVNFTDKSVDLNGPIIQWSWSFGDYDTSSSSRPKHCYTGPGKYNVSLMITDNVGCKATKAIAGMIDIYSFPIPAFVISPQPTTIMDPNMQFSDKSRDSYGPISSWFWNFNDPNSTVTSRIENPMHKYSDTGTYCVTLTVSNIHGCTDSITECLVISNNYTLYIPDAFSPNGDNKNDIFLPKGGAITEFQMYIFDRWGTLLYSTTDFNKGWDGTTNGGLTLQADTYVYVINVTDNFKKKHNYIGKVSLIR